MAANAQAVNLELLDESSGATAQGWSLTRIYRVGGDTVRIRVVRDHYEHQSLALAEVLSTDRTWTHLLSAPPSRWHQSVRAAELHTVADELLGRAVNVLGGEPR